MRLLWILENLDVRAHSRSATFLVTQYLSFHLGPLGHRRYRAHSQPGSLSEESVAHLEQCLVSSPADTWKSSHCSPRNGARDAKLALCRPAGKAPRGSGFLPQTPQEPVLKSQTARGGGPQVRFLPYFWLTKSHAEDWIVLEDDAQKVHS